MNGFFENSVFFGVWISLLFYGAGCLLKKKLKMAIFNPLLIAILLTILFLLCFHIDCAVYQEGARYLSFLLTPATVCLAVPLYEQMELLKRNWRAVLAGIAAHTGYLSDFDFARFYADIDYYYLVKGSEAFQMVYLAAGVGLPLLLQRGQDRLLSALRRVLSPSV